MSDLIERQRASTVVVMRAWLRRHGLGWVTERLEEARQAEIEAEARKAADDGETTS